MLVKSIFLSLYQDIKLTIVLFSHKTIINAGFSVKKRKY